MSCMLLLPIHQSVPILRSRKAGFESKHIVPKSTPFSVLMITHFSLDFIFLVLLDFLVLIFSLVTQFFIWYLKFFFGALAVTLVPLQLFWCLCKLRRLCMPCTLLLPTQQSVPILCPRKAGSRSKHILLKSTPFSVLMRTHFSLDFI